MDIETTAPTTTSSEDRQARVDLAAVYRLLAHHGSMRLEVYEADHAFVNDARPEVYAPGAAKLAWERTVAFLHQHLG